MNKEIIIRYSEITLKGKNRMGFTNLLFSNIKRALKHKGLEASVKKGYDKIYIKPENNIDSYIEPLQKVVGISWFSIIEKVEMTKEALSESLNSFIKELNNEKTFRVSAKAVNKELFESSNLLTNFVANHILENTNLKVNLNNYDVDVTVHITAEKEILVYSKKHQGIIGLPAGSNGKGLSLLSGGIDSPVAAYKTITRGINVSFVTFLNNVTGNPEVISKIRKLAEKINSYNGKPQYLYLVNFTRIQKKITELENTSYRITLLRRYYFRFAELLAEKFGYDMFITGDSLGQVASQTIQSMEVISEVTNKIIVRPLISSSKNEIINEAIQINTLDSSNLPGSDMCAMFVPKKPIIFPTQEEVDSLESELKDMEETLQLVLEEDMRAIKLGENNE